MRLIPTHQVFDSLKPNQVNNTSTVRKMSHQTSLTSLAYRFKAQYLTFQLNIRHIAIYFMDVIKTASIYIFIREIVQQVTQGKDIQFLVQYGCPLRTNTLQILYVASGDVEHNISANSKSNGVVSLIFSRFPSTK